METKDLLDWYHRTFVENPQGGYALMNSRTSRDKYSRKSTPLTALLITLAFDGKRRPRTTVPYSFACVPAAPNNTTKQIALDIDMGGLDALKSVLALCDSLGLWAFAQMSYGSQHAGGHVRIMLAEPVPCALASDIARRLLAATDCKGEYYPLATAASTPDLRLPIMPHLRAAKGAGMRQPLLLQTGELISTERPYSALRALHDAYQPNSLEQLINALEQLPELSVERPTKLHKSVVNAGRGASVIDWFNREYDLFELLDAAGAKGRGRVLVCPFHSDHSPSMGVFQLDNGRYVCKCFSRASGCPLAEMPYADAFNLYCLINRLSPSEAVKQIAAEHGLGQKRAFKLDMPQAATGATTVTPEQWADHLAIIAARRSDLAHALDAATGGRVTAIRATMGLGKTHAAAAHALARHRAGHMVAIAAPTHKIAEQWAAMLDGAGFVWQPREVLCDCHDLDYMKRMAELGYSLPCTYDCDYKAQHAKAKGKIVIFQHNHLHLDGGELFKGYETIIIDESPLSALMPLHVATLDDLRTIINRAPADDPAQPLLAALYDVGKARGRKTEMLRGTELHSALADRLGGPQALQTALDAAQASPYAQIRPRAPEYTQQDYACPQFLGLLLDALRIALDTGAAILGYGHMGGLQWGYGWYERKRLLSKLAGRYDTRVIILDGSANSAIYEQLCSPWQVDTCTIDAPLSPYVKVVQCTATASTRKMVIDDGLLQRTANQLAYIGDQLNISYTGGIAYKRAVEYMSEALGGQWLHYGGQRGSNELAGARAIAVVGSPTVPADALHLQASALWQAPIADTSERLDVAYYRPIDSRLDALVSVATQEELLQSVYRARPVTAEQTMTIVVASPWPLDALGVPVARIVELPHGNSTELAAGVERYKSRLAPRVADSVERIAQPAPQRAHVEPQPPTPYQLDTSPHNAPQPQDKPLGYSFMAELEAAIANPQRESSLQRYLRERAQAAA